MDGMLLYQRAFLLCTILINFPALFFIMMGLFRLSWLPVAFWLGILVLVWVPWRMFKNGKTGAFGISLAVLNVLWWPLLAQTIRRLMFMRSMGLEGADGHDVSGAFLAGMAAEQIFFLPITLTLGLGMVAARQQKRKAKASCG